jgi:hypothetical protein
MLRYVVRLLPDIKPTTRLACMLRSLFWGECFSGWRTPNRMRWCVRTWMRSRGSPTASFRQYGSYTLNRCIASTAESEGGARGIWLKA